MTPENAKRLTTPLRLVFWGGLVCVVDFNVNRFDLLHDWVGVLLVFAGVYRLADVPVHEPYRRLMQIVRLVAACSVFSTFFASLSVDRPTFVQVGGSLLGVAEVGAMVAFCVAMRWACERAGASRSARSWRTTTLLFTLIYFLPLGVFYLAAASAIFTGESFHIDLGPAGLVLLPVFLAPLVYLFVSTSRMIAEAGKLAAAVTEAGRSEVDEAAKGPVQFTLRTLLVVTVAVAILGGFLARPTLFYWQLSMAGLVALGAAVFAIEMRKVAWGVWIGALLLLIVGSASITSSGAGGTYGFRYPTDEEFVSQLEGFESWLREEEFVVTDAPEPERPRGLIFPEPEQHERTCYVRETPGVGRLRIIVEKIPEDRHVRLHYNVESKGFGWDVERYMEKAEWFQERLVERIETR